MDVKCFMIDSADWGAMLSKSRMLLMLSLLALTLESCSVLHGGLQFDYEKFTSEKEAWTSAQIQNYSFEYYSSGFMFEDVMVIVENGIYKESVGINNSVMTEYPKSINDIYAELEAFYWGNVDTIYFDTELYVTSVKIEYDSNHIPAKVSYESHIPIGMCVDGNSGFSIKNFSVN